MTLTATGPAGTAHDPFAGQRADDGAALDFPAERYTAVGATEQDVADLTAYFDSLTRQEKREAIKWHDARDDEQVAASLSAFRQQRDAFAAFGMLTDEDKAGLEALTDDEREALAGLTEDDRAALEALTPEQRAELSPETAGGGAQAGAGQPDGGSAGTGKGDGGSGPQAARFTTEQIGDLKIPEVLAAVERGEVTAGDALLAESARGDDARKTLVAELNKLLPASGA